MNDFKPGQRWICDADLQLGLGTVQTVEERTVSITFTATGETRTYARQSAPLTRIIFNVGDPITHLDNTVIKIAIVQEENGLLAYSGHDANGQLLTFPEQQLADRLQFSRPTDRLFNQLLDPDKWFRLRYQTWLLKNQFFNTPIYGLPGARTSLIPHQLYIAHEVGRRYAPRVLLADEVGLGKTIEAGMILHQQLLTGRTQRILIVVPETLIHQWLVEMLRRFNLYFSLFDETRFATLEENHEDANPFHSEQLVLCSLNFLCNNPKHKQAALQGDWDLLVVDEAHHLEWSETESSLTYQVIEQLAARIRGVLLLTATPEQLGKTGHFARLRLLDPDRFADFQHFDSEEKSFEPVANIIEKLLDGQVLNDALKQTLLTIENTVQIRSLLNAVEKPDTTVETTEHARHTLANILLDRHGTGRILFRNTRAAIKGFPERELTAYPLTLPQAYDKCLTAIDASALPEPQLLLCPELAYQETRSNQDTKWTEIDSRINWLHRIIQQIKPEKILVITAHAQTAIDIALTLKRLTNQHIPIFHEQMSLVERDRAAALFADQEASCQLLVCSEIGSEGRNFQFAHHLVLFDLPFNPDLLEQRIGRLDRIGQTETIKIHVPYLQNSAQAVLFHWYHDGLNIFEKPSPSGQTVFQQFKQQLTDVLHQRNVDSKNATHLIEQTRKVNQSLSAILDRGRDRILEYNSCRQPVAGQLVATIIAQETDDTVQHYMDTVFDCFGIHIEAHRSDCHRIEPSEHMTTSFAGLPDEGQVITYRRDVALANEDMQFLTWEHPMVINAMHRILDNETGNATVSSFSHRSAKPGTLFLECLCVLELAMDISTASRHNLPSIMVRTLIDEHGCSDYPALDHITINDKLTTVSPHISSQIIELKKEVIKEMVTASEQLAELQFPTTIQPVKKQIKESLITEIERLTALQTINPNVRHEEIHFFESQLKDLTRTFDTAQSQLDAIRVIVAT